jgi:hypothetical protein
VWLVVQLAALLPAVARVPLAADYPRAGERLAIYMLLAMQTFAAAALMPWLLRGWRAAVLAAASCWPLLAIAAMLSSVAPARALGAAAYLTAWIAALTVWHAASPSRRVAFTVSAAASAVAAGGPLLWYLRAEFVPPDASPAGPPSHYGPVLAAFSLVECSPDAQRAWPALIAAIASGGLFFWIRRSRSLPPTSAHPATSPPQS